MVFIDDPLKNLVFILTAMALIAVGGFIYSRYFRKKHVQSSKGERAAGLVIRLLPAVALVLTALYWYNITYNPHNIIQGVWTSERKNVSGNGQFTSVSQTYEFRSQGKFQYWSRINTPTGQTDRECSGTYAFEK